jgi:DNA modification methylase
VALVADAIRDCTAAGEIVLDPFLGEATTLIAAEQTGRICYAIESDPLRLDRAVRHWQQVTGLSAAHGQHGMSFNRLAEVRNGERY